MNEIELMVKDVAFKIPELGSICQKKVMLKNGRVSNFSQLVFRK